MQPANQSHPLPLTYNDYKLRHENLEGLTLGDYRVIKQLGKGSFGKVYKAKNKQGTFFAVKLLDKKEARDEPNPRIKAIRERLIQSEPTLMRQCDSPNLIKLFDIFENRDLKILIIEYCGGKTLADEIKARKEAHPRKKFSEAESVDILRHIINGIAELHRHSIVHRDLKTENVMKHEGIYKIIDFGFSKKLELVHQSDKTKNTVLGTPTTMAPEVMLHKHYGLKADIWSIGIIFFEIVFGSSPYDSSNAKAFFGQIQKRFSNGPTPYNDITLSAQAHDFLKRALKVDPDQRIGWREMIDHPLIKIKEGEPITGRFTQRHELKAPVVAKQLANGSLISAEIDIDESEIKMRRQPQTVLSNRKEQMKEHQKQYENEVRKKRQVQQDKKMGQKGSKETIKRRFDLDKLIEEEKEAEINRKMSERNLVEMKTSPSENREIREMGAYSTELFKIQNDTKKETSSEYKYCLQLHLQCLKTQFVYRNIFEPIEEKNLLDMEKRESIQFMQLLISRCFKNLSPLKEKLKNNAENLHRAFRNLNSQIQELYAKVSLKFNFYDKKLLQKQNKYMEIAKDFMLKVFNRGSQNEKNKILGGVELRQDEPLSEFGDFTKEEQIEYTQTYISKIVPKMAERGVYTSRIKKYLQFYGLIMKVTMSDLGEQSFSDFVERILL